MKSSPVIAAVFHFISRRTENWRQTSFFYSSYHLPAPPGCAFKNRDPVQNPQTGPFWGRLYGMTVCGYNGMTTNSYCKKARFRHSDKAPGRNLDATASLPNEELGRGASERRTSFLFGERRTSHKPVSFALPTRYPVPATTVLPFPSCAQINILVKLNCSRFFLLFPWC